MDRRWLAFGSFGTSRLSMTVNRQRVVGLRLIWGDPCSQIPVYRRWLAFGSFGTTRLSKTTGGQRVVGL